MRHKNVTANRHGSGGPEVGGHGTGYAGNGLSQFSRAMASGGEFAGKRTPKPTGGHHYIPPPRPLSVAQIKKRKRRVAPTDPLELIFFHEKLLDKLRDRLLTATDIGKLDKIRRSIEVKSEYLERLRAEFVRARQ
jgi:hypothetical protein